MRFDRTVEPALPGASPPALIVLVALAILSPWFFGSVHPLAVRILSGVSLSATLLAVVAAARRGGLALPAVPLWPALALLAVGLIQLVPLPPALHAILAPGSCSVWHPGEPAAANVLGPGPHPISVDPGSTLRWLALTGGLLLLALASAPALARSHTALRAVVAVSIGGLAVSTFGIFARARFGSLLYGRIPVPTVSPFGPFVSKNHFAGYVEMATLLCFGLVLGLADPERASGSGRDERRSSRALLALVAALAMALGVLISSSRGGVFSLVAGGLALLGGWLGLRRSSASRGGARWIAALGLVVLITALFAAVLPREVHDRMRSTAGASFRVDTWRDALRTAAASPLVGQGMGAFHDAFPRFKRSHGAIRVEHAENDYLEVLVDGGVLGLGLALGALLVVGGLSLNGLWRSADPLLRGIGIGALAGLAALAVHSALDFNLRIPSNAALAAFLVAIACAGAGPPGRRLPAAAALAGSAVLAFGVAAVLFESGPSLPPAEREVRAASSSESPEVRALRLERAASALGRLARARPAQAEPWLLLAWTRAAQGDWPTALALARHAVSLDPERPDLRAEADRLRRGAQALD